MMMMIKKQTYRWQNLRLRDDAVGQSVLSALCRNLCPCDLEACDWLMGLGAGHSPEKMSRDVVAVEGEGCRQVYRFS